MIDVCYYLATRDVLARCGLLGQRYRTEDGLYIIDNKDLSRITPTSEEYLNGVSGISAISVSDAKKMIAENSYTLKEE